MLRIGLIGGTFDPVHLGHLIGAERAADSLSLDRVMFVPAAAPPHKSRQSISAAHHRVNMLRAAIEGNPHFDLLTDEIERGGASYTIDTVLNLKARLGEGYELHLIVGADNLVDFNSWKDWLPLSRECRLVGLERPGDRDARVTVAQKIPEIEVQWVEMPLIGISSTLIRTWSAAGKSLRYLVTEPVAEYINQHNLYRAARG